MSSEIEAERTLVQCFEDCAVDDATPESRTGNLAQIATSSDEIEAERILVQYLEDCAAADSAPESRTYCDSCQTSRYLYCPYCYEILAPRESWPESVRDGTFRLPFDVDVILDDKRLAATGIHLKTLMKMANGPAKDSVQLFACDQNDEIPKYEEFPEGTFLLFPGSTSVPLSSVLATSGIKKLVALDCRWSRPSIRFNPSIASLKRVHLDFSPKQSYFWRYHDMGEGMLCTIEAIYFSAWHAAGTLGWKAAEQQSLVHMMWLFAQQREVIRKKYASDDPKKSTMHLPFSEEGKEYNRALRRRKAPKGSATQPEDPP